MVWNLCVSLKGINFVPYRLKQAYFFSFIQFVISFYPTTVFKVLYITLPGLVEIIKNQQCKALIHKTEHQMGLREYYIIHGQ